MSVDQKNLDIYGDKPLPWSRALEQLETGASGTYWLATTRRGGRPHVAAVGALWIDGKIYFTTRARTRKGRNLAEHRIASSRSRSRDSISSSKARR